MSPTEKMLSEFNAAVAEHLGVPREDSWEPSLDVLAWSYSLCGSGLPHGFNELEAEEIVAEHFDRDLYRLGGWDGLGEHYCHLQGSRQSAELMPRATAERRAITYTSENSDLYEGEQIRVLDPCCETGRYLIAAHKLLGRRGFYMGCEEKTVFYKMALLNLVLLDVPGAVIHADSMNVDLSSERSWDACNEWPGKP